MGKIDCLQCGAANMDTARYCAACGKELPKQQHAPTLPENYKPLPPPKDRKLKASHIAGIVVGVAAFWTVIYFVRQRIIEPMAYEKLLKISAMAMNKGCPRMIDDATQLDSVTVLPGNMYEYHYTIVNVGLDQVDPAKAREMIMPSVTEAVKNAPDMKMMRDHKTTFVYSYNDKDGHQMLKFSVTPDMYE